MSLSKAVVIFGRLNENQSDCSAWLNDKDRFCQRTIADSDQKRRRLLRQSISCGQEYTGHDAEEIVDLYFCKGWHRKGGRYAVPSTERLKVLQACFPRTPEANKASATLQPGETDRRTTPSCRPLPSRYVVGQGDSPSSLVPVLMTENETTSLPSEAPASLVTNIGSIFEGPEIPEAERLSFSIAQSALNFVENNLSALSNSPAATSTLASTRAESSPVKPPPSERDFQRQAQAGHLSSDHVNESPSIQQRRRSARIREVELGDPSELSRLTGQAADLPLTTPATRTRQRARIREQEISTTRPTDHQSNDRQPSSHFALQSQRRSARIQGQGQLTNINASGAHALATTRTSAPQNSQTSRSNDRDHIQSTQHSLSASTRRPLGHRMTRDVNEVDECGICKEALGAGSNVARCRNCANDFHKLCLAEWCTTGSKTCGFCRAPFSNAHVKKLIESLGDEGTKFKEQYQ